MTPAEIKDLVQTLRDCGVIHYKSGDVELELGPVPVVMAPVSQPKPQESNEIIHKVVEMTSLLKLDDKDLVDRLFPDHTEEYGDAEEPAQSI